MKPKRSQLNHMTIVAKAIAAVCVIFVALLNLTGCTSSNYPAETATVNQVENSMDSNQSTSTGSPTEENPSITPTPPDANAQWLIGRWVLFEEHYFQFGTNIPRTRQEPSPGVGLGLFWEFNADGTYKSGWDNIPREDFVTGRTIGLWRLDEDILVVDAYAPEWRNFQNLMRPLVSYYDDVLTIAHIEGSSEGVNMFFRRVTE